MNLLEAIMKLKLLAFTLFQMISLHSAMSSEVVKTFDGAGARCSESADVGNRAYQLELLSETKEKRKGDEIVTLNLDVKLLKCDKVIDYFLLRETTLDEKITILNATHQLTSLSVVAFTESGKLLDQSTLTRTDFGTYQVNLKVNKSRLEKDERVFIHTIGTEKAEINENGKVFSSEVDFISGSYSLLVK